MKIHRWTKNGWSKHTATPHEAAEISKPSVHISHGAEDITWPKYNEMSIISDVWDEIQYGPVGIQIDELPHPLRMIVESPYDWHIHGTRLFRTVDPITQAVVYGEAGTDIEDRDPDADGNTITRRFLELAGIIDEDTPSSDIMDLFDSSSGVYADVDINRVSNGVVCNEPDDEDESTEDSYENTCAPCIPLPSSAIDEVHDLRETCQNEEEFEQRLDKVVRNHLTSINSPLCGYGYSAPRKRYTYISVPRLHTGVQAATERTRFFYTLFAQVCACDSLEDLYGPLCMNENGKFSRNGGFIGSIRNMYNHDKELLNKWSIKDIVREDGSIQKSALTTERDTMIDSLRALNTDEETIRKYIYSEFDRVANNRPAVYSMDRKLVKPSKSTKNSKWLAKRSEAFEELFLTRAQWKIIYDMAKHIKLRVRDKINPATRKATLEMLAEEFRGITSISELHDYMARSQKRHIADKLVLSKLDNISVIDESQWRKSCAKLKRHLIGRLALYSSLRESIKSSKPTNLPEMSIPCPDPRCDSMAIGIPVWHEIQDGLGLLGVPCECGKVVWDTDHKSVPELKEYNNGTN
jgi:hypothetical protein